MERVTSSPGAALTTPAGVRSTAPSGVPVRLRGIVELPGGAVLDDLWGRPAGPARVGEAVSRMRRATEQAMRSGWDEVRKQLPAGVKTNVVEPLWINNSLIVDFELPSPDATGAVQAIVGWKHLLAPPPPATVPPQLGATTPGVTPPPSRPGWHLERLGAPDAWRHGRAGAGATIGVIDSGMRVDHPEIAGAYRGHRGGGVVDHAGSYFDPRQSSFATPRVTYGHGSWVAALAAGAKVGVAPAAKVVGSVQWGTTKGLTAEQHDFVERTDMLRAIQWMTAPTGRDGTPDPALAPQVVNDSWHAGDGVGAAADRYLDAALRNAAAAGIVHVVAAGNSGGPGAIRYPADTDAVIAVSGVDEAGRPIPGHAQGPSTVTSLVKPDVAAPETNLTSIRAGGGYQSDPHGGTSSAAPQVAGVLAIVDGELMRGGEAPVDVREARLVLQRLARDVHTPGPDIATGHGVPDLRRLDDALATLRAHRAASKL